MYHSGFSFITLVYPRGDPLGCSLLHPTSYRHATNSTPQFNVLNPAVQHAPPAAFIMFMSSEEKMPTVSF